jgi:hypothetical protein
VTSVNELKFRRNFFYRHDMDAANCTQVKLLLTFLSYDFKSEKVRKSQKKSEKVRKSQKKSEKVRKSQKKSEKVKKVKKVRKVRITQKSQKTTQK